MAEKLKFVIPVVAILFLVMAGRAYAVGTASGTTIGNFATMTATNVPSATQTLTVNTVVTGIHGATTTLDPADGNASVGSFVDYKFKAQNKGNESDSIGIKTGVQNFGTGAGTTTNWSVAADDADPFVAGLTWQTSLVATASQAGDQATMAAPLAPDAEATYTVRVTVAGDALDGSTGSFQVSFVTAKTPAGIYTGYNGTTYGGLQQAWRAAGTIVGATYLTTTVQGPVLTLTKTVAAVLAPAGYTGGAADPVPGARITYTVVFGNSGTQAANSVVATDYPPANTTYETGTILSCFGGTGCGPIADGDANAGGDDCWWDGTEIGCDIATVAAGGGGRLQYSVIIQ